jgi:hypothetical protein
VVRFREVTLSIHRPESHFNDRNIWWFSQFLQSFLTWTNHYRLFVYWAKTFRLLRKFAAQLGYSHSRVERKCPVVVRPLLSSKRNHHFKTLKNLERTKYRMFILRAYYTSTIFYRQTLVSPGKLNVIHSVITWSMDESVLRHRVW